MIRTALLLSLQWRALSFSAPALAGEAQSVVCLEKASDWLSGSPGTQSGREVWLR